MSRPSYGIGSWRLRRILPSPHCFQLIMDHAIGRVPYTPYSHCALTVRTDQGVPTRTLPVALAVGHRCDNLDRSLDDALDLGQGLLNQTLQPCKCLGRLYPVIAYPLEATNAVHCISGFM